MEIWKDIIGYEGLYQVSNLGRVKSFCLKKETIRKPTLDKYGYHTVSLWIKGKSKIKKIHQLVASSFLGHKQDGLGLVVNHKNFIRNDNRLENLEIVTARENTNRKHLKSTSKYVGVYFHKITQKWVSTIVTDGKQKHLGVFKNEIEASNAYQTALNEFYKRTKSIKN